MRGGAWIVAWEGPHMLARKGGDAQEALFWVRFPIGNQINTNQCGQINSRDRQE